jgi:hypothetical protein
MTKKSIISPLWVISTRYVKVETLSILGLGSFCSLMVLIQAPQDLPGLTRIYQIFTILPQEKM